jgi:hypothetical protein
MVGARRHDRRQLSVAVSFRQPADALRLDELIGVKDLWLSPPAPVVETIPPAPAPGTVWTSGYWSWNGVEYV